MYSVEGLGLLVASLEKSASSARSAAAVYVVCEADPMHDGGISPALELSAFQEQWYSVVISMEKDLAAAAEMIAVWRSALDRADG